MSKAILQIRGFLSGERHFPDPHIYRIIQVPDEITFYQLHCLLQLSFGWTNSHCHEFRDIFKQQAVFTNMIHSWEQDMPKAVDSRKVKIKEYLLENAFMLYVYDMSDNWVHGLFVEKVLVPATEQIYPICIAGAKSCPPEDCGGLGGYYEMLAILRRGKGELYKQYLQWLGGEYDPEYFNMEQVNSRLASWKKVARRWEPDTF